METDLKLAHSTKYTGQVDPGSYLDGNQDVIRWGREVSCFIKAWLLFHYCGASLFKRRIMFISFDVLLLVNRSLINPL